MSTTIVTNWATNIAELGPIYPFVGYEIFLVGLGIAFWIGFHCIQMKRETKRWREMDKILRQSSKIQEILRQASY